ncbi:alpha-L-fucosidase [uncultured Streptomyces sp.]|uniref:alpha-L-fucosidase n=1 Tax=uncultured Streptomyces sp. TaxID=174707 RepID=UPI0026204F86|nr:alpha-L-fucosidase [uncultured Streptomyces sp.]
MTAVETAPAPAARPDQESPVPTAIVPTPQQSAWQRDRLGVFFHFGMNTFHGVEWSDGTLPASSFDPSDLDADQWVATAKELGARYVVLTAKHHDGFCLWPTATTDYSVRSSPWRDGRGDVVREVSDACARHGVKFGFYLSPWDRNAPAYADEAAYDDFYAQQLRELCTGYGRVDEIWFDGAGSEGHRYDWARISSVIHELQPQAMVFNMGAPTIRWVGNEDGLAADPVEYVVRKTEFSNYTVETVELTDALYLPPECDVSLRRGWFWHPEDAPKTLDHLLAIYYRSVGLGANLLLNLPPDSTGRLPQEDVRRLRELRTELDRRFAAPLPAGVREVAPGVWELDFGSAVTFDHLWLTEELAGGQRVTAHELCDATGTPFASGFTVGSQRVQIFEPVTTRTVTVRVTGEGAVLTGATAFLAGVTSVPEIAYLATTDAPL